MTCKGLPRAKERSRRVRVMYSLRHDARAVRRVNARLSERTAACTVSSSLIRSELIESGPGK